MNKKGIVFGAGLSGLGAKELLEKNGYEVYLIDDKAAMPSAEGIRLLNEEKIEFIVKSPWDSVEGRTFESCQGKRC